MSIDIIQASNIFGVLLALTSIFILKVFTKNPDVDEKSVNLIIMVHILLFIFGLIYMLLIPFLLAVFT